MDRRLSSAEQTFLDEHLLGCRECREYQRWHKQLQALASGRQALSESAGNRRGPAFEEILLPASRKRRLRKAVKVLQYGALTAFTLLVGFWVLPMLPDVTGSSNPPISGTTLESPTKVPTASATKTPTPAPSMTQFARFNFGNVVAWPEVRFFRRGDHDVVNGEAIRGDPQRENDITLEQVQASSGFDLQLPGSLPEGYTFGHAWYEPTYDSAGVCYVGPLDSRTFSRPRLCIRQQPAPFEDFVGHSAEVRSTTISGTYAEYVQGGWLSISPAGSPQSVYQWDDRMVPTTSIRFALDGIYFQVFDISLDCSDPNPVCPDTKAFAESLD